MSLHRKLRILFAGEELKRFYPQINALSDQHEFIVEDHCNCLQNSFLIGNLSMIVFQKRVVCEYCAECIKKVKNLMPQTVVVVFCEKVDKKTLYSLFRYGVRDVLEQSFEKIIELEVAIDKVNAIFSNGPKNRERRYSYSSLRHMKELTNSPEGLIEDNRIERAKTYIEQNYSTPLDLDEIANIACISKYHFCRTFKKNEGISFTGYLNNVRIGKAKELLKDRKLSVAEVAFEVGFHSLSHFTTLFKNHLNVSPGEFRKIAFKVLFWFLMFDCPVQLDLLFL